MLVDEMTSVGPPRALRLAGPKLAASAHVARRVPDRVERAARRDRAPNDALSLDIGDSAALLVARPTTTDCPSNTDLGYDRRRLSHGARLGSSAATERSGSRRSSAPMSEQGGGGSPGFLASMARRAGNVSNTVALALVRAFGSDQAAAGQAAAPARIGSERAAEALRAGPAMPSPWTFLASGFSIVLVLLSFAINRIHALVPPRRPTGRRVQTNIREIGRAHV